MGSKGSQTTQAVNQNQSYTADPRVSAAAGQALTGAQNAASQPFQMPVAPIAGFNADQTQAQQQYGQIQGMAQPYFDQAAQYTSQSAAPITGADVNQYYNPMADNVTAQLQNIYGQQNVQNQGMSTAKAGGVGADRIAVGMGNLANQQGLASGQIYSQLYQQALQAAQQQKSMAAGAGSAFAGYGTGAQTAALQGTGALNQSGNQQQQQSQAQLNAPYQNQLAQIAYQFQTPQYLAGIAGGLAPALGGTTTGAQNSVTTPPTPSALSQGLGLATAGAGIYGATGGMNGKGSGSPTSYADVGGYSMPQYAEGGEVESKSPTSPHISKWRNAYFADGGETEDQGPAIPGMHLPKTGGTATPIPVVSMPMGAGHSGPLTGGMSFPSPEAPKQESGGFGDILKTAASVLPFFLDRGGTVPHYDDGGDIDFNADAPFSPTMYKDIGKKIGRDAPATFYNPSGYEGPAPPTTNFNDRFGASFPQTGKSAPAPTGAEVNPNPVPAGKVPLPTPYPQPDTSGAIRLDPSAKPEADDEVTTTPAKAAPTAYSPPGRAATNPYMMPQAQQPYPDSLKRDWGQNMTRSPWMALIKAGATMAATPGPLGVSLGKGMLAGAGGLDSQRKELRSEQELNDKAQALYQNAQVHLDKYTKMTPYEQGSLTARNREIDQGAPDTGVGAPKELDVQRIIKGMNESLDPKYMTLPLDEKRRLAIQMLRPGSGAAANVPPAAGPAVGSIKEFDDGKGGKVNGVWDGTKYVPKP